MLKNFRTYQLAVAFYRACDQIHCKPYIRDQLGRSSLSVVNNLAEGSAKSSMRDRARYYEIALASYRESVAMLEVLNHLKLRDEYDKLGASLFKLHRQTLTTAKQTN